MKGKAPSERDRATQARLDVREGVSQLVLARVQLLCEHAQNQAACNDFVTSKARAASNALKEREEKDQG